MKKIIPLSLRKHFEAINNVIDHSEVIELSDNIAHDDMTFNQLINNIAKALLKRDNVNVINDCSFEFRTALLHVIEEAITNRYQTVNKEFTWFDSDGTLRHSSHPHIVNHKDQEERYNPLSNPVKEHQDYLVLKGSEKKLDNNSKNILDLYSSVENRIRDDFNEQLIELYGAIKYEENKNKQSDSSWEYRKRILALVDETKLHMGHVFNDHRKLDSSTRDYPLQYFGFAYQYGDSFQKWLVQPELTYTVNQEDREIAQQYLIDEYGVTNANEALQAIHENLRLLDKWRSNKKVKFTCSSKELGKHCQIVSIVDNIINNVGGESRELIALDFTNSGGVMFANQFGDEKFLEVANLIGDTKSDAHQLVADFLGLERSKAKKVMQGPNHGQRLNNKTREIALNVFGEAYLGINALAEFGKAILMNNPKAAVPITAPDGVRGYFYGYVNSSTINVNGTKVGLVAPFTKLDVDGKKKGYGFAVKPAHGSDGYVLREVRRKLIALSAPHLTILDAYYIQPSMKDQVTEIVYNALDELHGWFDSQIDEIENQTGIKMQNRPKSRSIAIQHTGLVF